MSNPGERQTTLSHSKSRCCGLVVGQRPQKVLSRCQNPLWKVAVTRFFVFFYSITLVCLRGRCAITIPEFPVSVSLVANIGARNKCCRSFHQCTKAVKCPKLKQEPRSLRLKCYAVQTEQRANICKYTHTHTSPTYYLFCHCSSLEGTLAVNINRPGCVVNNIFLILTISICMKTRSSRSEKWDKQIMWWH